MGLPYLDQAMRVWGHRFGLTVALMDADVVTETNCIRQPFAASDIGQNKATVLINRINLFWGTQWQAIPNHFHERSFDRNEGYPKKQLPMWHRYRVELYPHIPGLGLGSGILDKWGNELEFPSAFRQSRRDGTPRGIIKIKYGGVI